MNYEIPVYKCLLVRDSQVATMLPPKALTPEAAAEVVKRHLDGADREHLIVLLVDKQMNITGVNTVSVGSIDQTVAEPREIFKPAFLMGAFAIILAHNHPGGDATPSTADRVLHKRIRDCGRLLRIELLDAIIVGDGTGQIYSAARENPYEFAGGRS